MAEIIDTKDIALDDLEIGISQIRLSDVAAGVDELARSIDSQGLLQPIVVGPENERGKHEIILGQRRFLAHKELGRKTIRAQVLDERLDEIDAKVISLTENMMRRDISRRDKIDVCTTLFKRYGTMKDVAEATGLPYREVQSYVKYDRLEEGLREMVDRNEISTDVALRAQDAASVSGELDAEEAVTLAKEMASMSGAQRKRLADERERSPEKSVEEVIEDAKESKVKQVIVTLLPQAHTSLQEFAKEEGTNQDDAAGSLITEALRSHGYEA